MFVRLVTTGHLALQCWGPVDLILLASLGHELPLEQRKAVKRWDCLDVRFFASLWLKTASWSAKHNFGDTNHSVPRELDKVSQNTESSVEPVLIFPGTEWFISKILRLSLLQLKSLAVMM